MWDQYIIINIITVLIMSFGGTAGLGPGWTRGEIEAPQGEKNMGTFTAAVYTAEQMARLGVNEQGQKVDEDTSAKTEWPELVDKDGEEAVATIKRERPDLTQVSTMPEGAMMTMDMRMDRVRVMVNTDNKVAVKPRIA